VICGGVPRQPLIGGATMAAKTRAKYILLKKSEIKQIREFTKFAPSLEKYRGKKKITVNEYSAFKRVKNKLRHTENLKPVTALQAKKLKGQLVGGGIRAVRLRNTAPDAKVRVRKGGIIVTSNGRDWEYHPVKPKSALHIADALIEKGLTLFNRKQRPPWQLHLWTTKGRASEGFSSFNTWLTYIQARFNAYQNADEFISGVAALVKDQRGFRDEIKNKAKFSPDIEEDEEEE
jgi:hypothetical protein